MTKKDSTPLAIPPNESESVEFALASVKPDRLARVVCAFLNSQGGTLYVGVDDMGIAVGIENAQEFAESLRKTVQDQVSPKALWSVSVEEIDSVSIVTVSVPEGQERPYVCDGAIYVRRESDVVTATAESIHNMIEHRYRTPFRWERQLAAGLDLSDLDQHEIDQTVTAIRDRGRFDIPDASETSDFLDSLALIQSGSITNACAVLFAKNLSHKLPQTRVRATVFKTDKGGDFSDDRLFEGHAFSLINDLFAFIERNVRVAAEFKPGEIQRSDRREYPLMALREGIMNALTHRDYASFDGGMSLGVYPDRIEIWNSGSLPEGITPGALKKPHPSMPPNPDIAHVFYLRGLIERIGRGTLAIVEDCKRAALPAPTWKVNRSGVTLTIHGSKRDGRSIRLNERQQELLSELNLGDEIVPGDFYERMKGTVSQRQAQRDLTGLELGGWLRKEGDGPATIYIRTEQKQP